MSATQSRQRCALCKTTTDKAAQFFVLHERIGRRGVQLCPACVASLSWRADEAVLVADEFDGKLPRIFAGRAVRTLWRSLLEAGASRAAEVVAQPTKTDHGLI
jgi:hypothetical protein